MANLTGQSLGRYHILEQLGEGGMAIVYKAFDTRLERYVAVKVITTSGQQSEKFLKRFEREAKALAQLSHPNIVKVLDFGDQDGIPYLVMEYLQGGTLKKLLGRSMEPQQAASILLPICQALEYAHTHGIIHRDVKPSNILMTDSGQPMLSDFGIAKMLEAHETLDLTGTSVGIGTPEYMAPEQGRGKADNRSDIYSVGIVFYEMITGHKPYVADTPLAVVLMHATDPLPNPRKYLDTLPVDVEKILLKALAKDPGNRYQNMTELLLAISNIANTTAKRYRKSSAPLKTDFSWLLAHRVLWGTAVAGIVLIASIIFLIVKANVGQRTLPAVTPSVSSAVLSLGTPILATPTPFTAYYWNFATGSNGWGNVTNDATVLSQDGLLKINVTGSNPFFYSSGLLRINAQATPVFTIRMRSTNGGTAKLYFTRSDDLEWNELKVKALYPENDNQFHTYSLNLNGVSSWLGTINQFKLVPTDNGSYVEIAFIWVHAP